MFWSENGYRGKAMLSNSRGRRFACLYWEQEGMFCTKLFFFAFNTSFQFQRAGNYKILE
jgi:hypothetical protein